jgi:4-hydroxy-4-methyl-2-oxoglutarate aldolase
MKKRLLTLLAIGISWSSIATAQNVTWSPENIKALTVQWKGERSADGRPKISDGLLERLKNVHMEEAWAYLRSKGYSNQFENFSSGSENPWIILHPEQAMTGRVVTAQFVPLRLDLDDYVQEQGKKEKNPLKITNSSPINILADGDVYVADGYGKMVDGTLIGGNLANAIFNGSKRGFIFNGSIRDVEQNEEVKGMNGWYKGSDPSYISQMMLSSINGPIRIGRATVLPGDVVLAKRTGVMFIPAQFVQDLVLNGEVTDLQDQFTFMRIADKTYEYKNEGFVGGWTEAVDKDFVNWATTKAKLSMPKEELTAYLTAHPRVKPPKSATPAAGTNSPARPAAARTQQ